MAAPGASALKFKGAAVSGTANTKQTDDTSAMGGDPDTVELVDGNADLLFDSSPGNALGGADILNTNVIYRSNEEGAGGKMTGLRIAWDNALRSNPGGGPLTITATAADAGKFLRIVGFVSGALLSPIELVPLIDGDSISITVPDPGKLWRVEVCDSTSTPTAPVVASAAGPIKISQVGTDCGQVPGPLADRNGNTIAFKSASGEFEMAVATAKNTSLNSSNRLSDPSGIGSYSRPIVTSSTDTSLILPDLNDGDFVGVAIRKRKVAGIPPTISGQLVLMHNVVFTPGA